MTGFTLELVGLDMAHKREMRQLSRDAQICIDQLDAEIIRLRGEVEKANIEIRRLSQELDKANNATVLSWADAAGLRAEAMAVYADIKPDSDLLTPTGRHFPNGDPEMKGHLIYNEAFDAVAAEHGLVGPMLRPVAE